MIETKKQKGLQIVANPSELFVSKKENSRLVLLDTMIMWGGWEGHKPQLFVKYV